MYIGQEGFGPEDRRYWRNVARVLRKNMASCEKKLWYGFLRNAPVKFRRQQVVGCYILDFYCHEARLGVELDGEQHEEARQAAHDRKRDEFIRGCGIRVIRFTNREVCEEFEGVCQAILEEVAEALAVG